MKVANKNSDCMIYVTSSAGGAETGPADPACEKIVNHSWQPNL